MAKRTTKSRKSRSGKGPAAPDRLEQLEGNPGNPRQITPEALRALRVSLETFGDLSGIVFNARTGHLVCAHQRRAALEGVDLSRIRWGRPQRVTLGRPGRRFESGERWGVLRLPEGAVFHVRQVDWPAAFEAAANVAANSPTLQGEFTEALQPLLHEIEGEEGELFEALGLGLLMQPTGEAQPTSMQKTEVTFEAKSERVKCPECGHVFIVVREAK